MLNRRYRLPAESGCDGGYRGGVGGARKGTGIGGTGRIDVFLCDMPQMSILGPRSASKTGQKYQDTVGKMHSPELHVQKAAA